MSNILIVEDDRDLNYAYRIILEREHYIVASVYDGQEALKKLETFEPDLILLDLLMPIKSGVEFLQAYDPIHKHPDAKILVFTNLENSPEINEAFNLGAYKCILKSWTAPQGLVKIVNDTLGVSTKSAKKKKTKAAPVKP